mmetsp:Transcript_142979/g.249512  ORF Transcript_142979/g.249512 Transcript_142979/m.249512 type:complete len:252 (+) Transcript_142979:828-1583(+)
MIPGSTATDTSPATIPRRRTGVGGRRERRFGIIDGTTGRQSTGRQATGAQLQVTRATPRPSRWRLLGARAMHSCLFPRAQMRMRMMIGTMTQRMRRRRLSSTSTGSRWCPSRVTGWCPATAPIRGSGTTSICLYDRTARAGGMTLSSPNPERRRDSNKCPSRTPIRAVAVQVGGCEVSRPCSLARGVGICAFATWAAAPLGPVQQDGSRLSGIPKGPVAALVLRRSRAPRWAPTADEDRFRLKARSQARSR